MSGPTAQIIICHNEAAAVAAADILGMDTAAAPGLVWASLHGRRVILWPANTPLSLLTVPANARATHAAGAASIKVIDPGPLAAPAWDAVAALAEGWGREEMLDWLRLRAVVWEPPIEDPELVAPNSPESAPAEPESPANDDDRGGGGAALEFPTPDDYGAPPGAHPADHGPALPPYRAPSGWDPAAPLTDRWEMLGLTVFKGQPVCNVDTVLRILGRHPQLGDVLWFDEFLQRIMRKDQKTRQPREWADADEVDLLALLQRDLGLSRLKLSDVHSAVISVAFRTRKNCAQDWLNGLKWDQKSRVDEFFQDTFGCESTVYSRAVSKNFWLSLVARAMDPGCKVDNMVILEGSQGAGKSSSMEAIGGAWFAVQHESVTRKDFYEVLQGKMLIEISEMEAFNKAEVTKVKGVVTTRIDRYRDAYGKYARDHLRTSIFVGTTNKDDWNRDETGARRFWPIRCRQAADMALIKANREQLFAEAAARWRRGESWWEIPAQEALEEQDLRREDDTWIGAAADWLADPYKSQTTVGEVLWGAIKMPLADQHTPQQKRMAAVLHRLGWRKKHAANGNIWRRAENEP